MTAQQQDWARFTHFGEFAFDPESHELFRDGKRILLQPKPARLLHLLLSRPGRLLSQQEISRTLWPDSVVEFEQRIRSAIRDIRLALDDNPERPRFIETVPRRGYRFIYPVETKASDHRESRKWLAVAGIILLTAIVLTLYGLPESPTEPSGSKPVVIAVLPVVDRSPAGFPVDGLTHELIATLAQLDPASALVIGRTSAMKFRNSQLSAAEIASQLGADYLLETTLVRGPDADDASLRLAATLIEPATGVVVWASNFSGTADLLPTYEQELLRGVAATLPAAEPRPPYPAVTSPPVDAGAYEAYMRGLDLLNRENPGARAESYAYFRDAVRMDPGFAQAYLGIARAAGAAGRPDSEARESIDRALEIDDQLGEAYFLRGIRRFFRNWNWADAGRDFETAVKLEPGRAEFHAFYAAFLRAAGDYDGAEREADLAMAGDPLSELVHRDNAWLLLSTGRYEQAAELCRRGLEIQLAEPAQSHNCLMLAHLSMGDIAAAANEAREIMALDGVDASRLAALSEHPPEDQLAAHWQWKLDRLGEATPDEVNHFQLAQVYSALGKNDPAIAALEQGLAARQPGMIFMMGDILLKPLRSDPRFLAIARAVGIPSVESRFDR